MSETLAESQANQNFNDNDVPLYDVYIFLLVLYAAIASVTAALLLAFYHIKSKRVPVVLVRSIDYTVRGVALLEILNIIFLLTWCYSIYAYLKMMAEFTFAIIGFFTREHQTFRWAFVIGQLFLMIVNVVFMVDIVDEIYCSETNNCSLDKTIAEAYVLYSEYSIGFYLECVGVLLAGLMMQHLGYCSNKQFPRKLNLERYGIQRPTNKNTIYDLFPHPAIYSIV